MFATRKRRGKSFSNFLGFWKVVRGCGRVKRGAEDGLRQGLIVLNRGVKIDGKDGVSGRGVGVIGG